MRHYPFTPSSSTAQPRAARRSSRWVVLSVLLGLLLLVPGVVSGQAPEAVGLDDLTGNLDDYIGRPVTIDGEVKDVIEPRVFVLGEGGIAGVGGAELLVMSVGTPSITIEDGAELRVTGRVGRFDLEAFELAVGGQLDDTAYADWDDEAVLVLESVEER